MPPSHSLLLPLHLRLDSLACRCAGQPVFLGLSRALVACRAIHVEAGNIHMLLIVSEALPPCS